MGFIYIEFFCLINKNLNLGVRKVYNFKQKRLNHTNQQPRNQQMGKGIYTHQSDEDSEMEERTSFVEID